MTSNELTLSIAFDGFGWATMTFASQEWERKIVASYIGDSPFGLLTALDNLDREDDPTTLSFNAEPDTTTVDIAWDTADDSHRPDSLEEACKALIQVKIKSPYDEPVEFLISYQRFCELCIQELDKEIRRLGIYGIARTWKFEDFPMGLYLKFKAIATHRYDFVEGIQMLKDGTYVASLKDELNLIQAVIPRQKNLD